MKKTVGMSDKYLVAKGPTGEWWVLTMRGRVVAGPYESERDAEDSRIHVWEM